MQDIGRHWNRKRSFHRLILFHRGLVRLSVSFMSSGSPPTPHISKAKLRKLAGYERCALLWHRSPIPLPSSLPGSAISMMRRHKMGTASSSLLCHRRSTNSVGELIDWSRRSQKRNLFQRAGERERASERASVIGA